ncbi:MAG: DUF433 domain-containing protein [Terrimicrobiaceae bacterium]
MSPKDSKIWHDLAGEHLAHGLRAEALQENHPELSLAQIHAALAWYHDHARSLDFLKRLLA